MSTLELNSLKVGDAVLLSKCIACVLYIGPVHWNPNQNEQYVGLELQSQIPNGHNGIYDGHKYFNCKENHGLILPISSIVRILKPRELLSKIAELKSLRRRETNIDHDDDSDSKIKVSVSGVLIKQYGENYKIRLQDSNNNDSKLNAECITVHERFVKFSDNDNDNDDNYNYSDDQKEYNISDLSISISSNFNKNDHETRSDSHSSLFPTNFNLFSIDIRECNIKNCRNCPSFKRINYCLLKYKVWNETSANQKCDINGFYNFMYKVIGNKYNNSKLLDDIHHLIYCHSYHDIFNNILEAKCNNYKECIHLKRNYRNRTASNLQYFDNNDTDIKEMNLQQIMDSIHCYCLHGYDLYYCSSSEWNQLLSSSKTNKNQNKNKNKIKDKDSEIISKIQTIIKPKIESRISLSQNERQNEKFMSSVNNVHIDNNYESEEKDRNGNGEDMIYDFGIQYKYWSMNGDRFYCKATHKSLKDEFVGNKMDIKNWNVLIERAKNHLNKKFSDLLIATKDYRFDFNIQRGDAIKLQHFISIMIYCNYREIRNEFNDTFIRLNDEETDKEMINRHAQFAYFGQYLFEIVHIYGKYSNEYDTFYYGINDNQLLFESTWCVLKGSSSCTSSLEVALNYSNEEGIILKLSSSENQFSVKYFDCATVSDFIAEKESFFIGNSHCGSALKFVAIIDSSLSIDYTPFIISIDVIKKLLNGKNSSFVTNSNNNSENLNLIYLNIINLFKNVENRENNGNKHVIPKYIERLFDSFVLNTTSIYIKWNMFKNDNILKSYLCFPFMVNLRKLLSIFTKCVEITIDGINVESNELNKIYMYLLMINPTSSKLKKIVIKSLNETSPSILSYFQSKLLELNCKMQINSNQHNLFKDRKEIIIDIL